MNKIDIVYLWVNGNDSEWRKRKEQALHNTHIEDNQACTKGRYCDSDELKYSLRSLEMYAPWINRVFIVTDDQTPSWLNPDHPKVRIVSHSEVIPDKYRPVFNSCAIEMCLTNIPDLSEYFLYANDDTLFNKPVGDDFFYDGNGYPIVRLMVQRRKSSSMYDSTVYDAQNAIKKRFGKYYPFVPHHNIDAYRKSDVEACMKCFEERVDATRSHRFRTFDDLQRSVFLYYALAIKHATMKIVYHYDGERSLPKKIWRALIGKFKTDSRWIPIDLKDIGKRISHYNPALICLNDNENVVDDDRRRMKDFLENRFPAKSSFEK